MRGFCDDVRPERLRDRACLRSKLLEVVSRNIILPKRMDVGCASVVRQTWNDAEKISIAPPKE